jgi:uncharacterized OB-fold protein
MSEVPRFWRLKGQLLRLEGSNCSHCGIKHFPPRAICPDCGYVKKDQQEKKGVPEIIYQSQEKTQESPYLKQKLTE